MKRPEVNEAAEPFFAYINRVPEGNLDALLEAQIQDVGARFSEISEGDSLFRYAPGKWSIREVLNHINDSERLFVFRAFWFARGFESPLPDFEQEIAAAGASANRVSLESHLDEFTSLRQSTVSFVRGLPAEAWDRRGVAGGSPISVRALMYVAAGHVTHHMTVLKERYGR